MAQQILKEVDGSFKSFFGLLKLAKKGKYNFKDIKLPKYLPKNSFTTLVIGFVRINKDTLIILTLTLFLKIIKRFQLNYRLFCLIRILKRLELFLNSMPGSLKFSTLMKHRNNKEI